MAATECGLRLTARKPLKTMNGQTKAALIECEKWNATVAVGAIVCLHRDSGERVHARTRSVAQVMCGSAVAWFDGISGAYAIDHAHALPSAHPLTSGDRNE